MRARFAGFVTEACGRRACVGIGAAALFFCLATTLTIVMCTSMSAKGGMPMPGGWTMSMAWARMCGQSWAGAAASFIGMWSAMTVTMMFPALIVSLGRGFEVVDRKRGLATSLVMRIIAAYFFVWIALGVAVYPLGVALAMLEIHIPALARVTPFAAGVIVVLAGLFQLSASKARYLACCRAVPSRSLAGHASVLAVWREGARFGWHCIGCCAGLTAMVLAIGIMDPRAMAFAAIAITGERIACNGERFARIAGGFVMAIGVAMLAHAIGRR